MVLWFLVFWKYIDSPLKYVNDGRPFWQYIVSSSTGCSDSQCFEELYNYYTTDKAWHLCDPDAKKVVEALRKAGVKVAVVSNFDTRLRPLLHDLCFVYGGLFSLVNRFKRILRYLKGILVLMHCDNLSATYMVVNPVFHACTKHIDLDYHFVQERVASGTHRVHFVPSVSQLSNLFTKSLSKTRFQSLCSKLVPSPASSLRESVDKGSQDAISS
ncbi:unnamed protein product [Malus baccata var. baccata]